MSVMRTCRDLGSRRSRSTRTPIRGALHHAWSDLAIPIGPRAARESYLDIAKILKACQDSGADRSTRLRVPLGERGLRRRLRRGGITFIGPTGESMRNVDKTSARQT